MYGQEREFEGLGHEAALFVPDLAITGQGSYGHFTSKNLTRRHVWASQCSVQVPFGVSGFEERSITPTITGIYSCFSYLCCNTHRSTSSTTLARVHTYNTGNEKKKQGHRDNESPSTFSNYKDKTKQTKTRTVGKVPQYKTLKFFSNIEGTWDMSE